MTQALLLNQNEYEELKFQIQDIHDILKNLIPEPISTSPQKGGIELAEEILGRSKSWIYKKISVLPHKKFGSKIIFDRLELEAWMSERTVSSSISDKIINNKLVESARKKLYKK